MKNNSHGNKPYQPASCKKLSISEFAKLVRKKTADREIQQESLERPAQAEVPILLVEDYAGDLNFIRSAFTAPAREPHLFSNQRGIGWFEMRFEDAQEAEPLGTFLVLDLRYCHREHRRFFDPIGHPQGFNEAVPRVILASSSEPLLDWTGVDREQCWRLQSCPSPEDLSAVLRSFLQLCAMFTDCMAEERLALEAVSKRPLTGEANKR